TVTVSALAAPAKASVLPSSAVAARVFRMPVMRTSLFGRRSVAKGTACLGIEQMQPFPIHEEVEDFAVRDGPRTLHARRDLVAAELGEEQRLVAERLGEGDGRAKGVRLARHHAVALGHDVLGTDAERDGSSRG